MDDSYADLRALMEKATPGPWHTKTECPARCCWHVFPSVEMFGVGEDAPIVMGECSEDDATFMVATRNALPGLLDELGRLREAATLALSIAEGCIKSDLEGTSDYQPMVAELDPVRAALTPQETEK